MSRNAFSWRKEFTLWHGLAVAELLPGTAQLSPRAGKQSYGREGRKANNWDAR